MKFAYIFHIINICYEMVLNFEKKKALFKNLMIIHDLKSLMAIANKYIIIFNTFQFELIYDFGFTFKRVKNNQWIFFFVFRPININISKMK